MKPSHLCAKKTLTESFATSAEAIDAVNAIRAFFNTSDPPNCRQ